MDIHCSPQVYYCPEMQVVATVESNVLQINCQSFPIGTSEVTVRGAAAMFIEPETSQSRSAFKRKKGLFLDLFSYDGKFRKRDWNLK
ncbi:hypothetical protein AVEN_70412-1 [Araneus ventricosus]|uniref:Uncharacterized protein n=1 Tax=Araneus ventricosus TaxID=182803 RepID=A0A4Y2QKR8_ARAVE|nr:hypothetical protein AVEN_70412-1 [Araneus ventricosus]